MRKRDKNAASAKARWNKDSEPCVRIPNAMPETQCERNAPTPTPISSDTDVSGEPEVSPVDFKKTIFQEGLKWLVERSKRKESPLRSMLGKWCRDYGDAAVFGAIMDAQRVSAIEPIAFIEKALQGKPTTSY